MDDDDIQIIEDAPPETSTEPLTLQELSLNTFYENCKNKKFKWDPTKINFFAGKMIWDCASMTRLIEMASYYNAPEYFSRIIQAPTTFQVTFAKSGVTKWDELCEVVLKFTDKPDFIWSLTPHKACREVNWQDHLRKVLRINKRNLRTGAIKESGRNKVIVSSLTNYRDTRKRTIEWICRLFHCHITSFRVFGEGNDIGWDQLLSWPPFIEARSITIDMCEDSDFLYYLVQERSLRNLKLTLSRVQSNIRLNVNALCVQVFDLNVNTVWREKRSNLTLSDLKEVRFFMYRLCDRHRTLSHDGGFFSKVMIPNLRGGDLRTLRISLNLKWREETTNWDYVFAKETVFEHSWKKKPTIMYSTNYDGTLMGFYFLKNGAGVYDQMVARLLKQKPIPEHEPDVITLD
ncbi:unnamed protein product [Caenorhabditis brenneri]